MEKDSLLNTVIFSIIVISINKRSGLPSMKRKEEHGMDKKITIRESFRLGKGWYLMLFAILAMFVSNAGVNDGLNVALPQYQRGRGWTMRSASVWEQWLVLQAWQPCF